MSLNPVKKSQISELSSFDSIYLQHKDMVFRTAVAMLSDDVEAEDLMQTIFIKVHNSKMEFKDEIHFKRWLHRITVNLCIDELRKHRNILRLDRMREKGIEPITESSKAKIEIKEELQQALACLDLKQRSVIILKYLHGLTYEEIAKTLGIPLGTVKSRLNTAIKIMRNKVII